MFNLRAKGKALQFEVRVRGENADYIVGDESKIRQVLINLLVNAIKFTERGRVSLLVSLDSRPTDGRLWLSVQVEDTGVGMTEEDRAEMFEPFSQGLSGQRIRHGGTGLGLAISRGVADLMGGSITVNSVPGKGSTFRFEVPVLRGMCQDLPEPSGNTGRVVALRPGQSVPRVLIADDVLDNRELLTSLLTTVGFSVRWAQDGAVAVDVWREWRPQLILMDAHMPVMDGLEAIRRIRSRALAGETVIIALTADVTDDGWRAVLQREADGLLSKPFTESELLEHIRAHLGIEYVYAKETVSEISVDIAPAAVALSSEQLSEIPIDLTKQLCDAILKGDRTLMANLIRQIDECGNTRCARGLQELSDGYQYDRLNELLEQAIASASGCGP